MEHLIEADPATGPAPRRHARQRAAWRLLLAHVRPHRWTLVGGGLLGFLGGLAALAEPMLAKLVIDSLGRDRSILGPVMLLAALLLGGALLNAAGAYLLGRTAESIVLTARRHLTWTGCAPATCSPGRPPTPRCCAPSAPTGWSRRSTRLSCWPPRSR
jgi:ABC-type bacteriocin/lantibiotic exporter with double-glycine peptidase domain